MPLLMTPTYSTNVDGGTWRSSSDFLNRIKSLQVGYEVEPFNLDDICKDRSSIKKSFEKFSEAKTSILFMVAFTNTGKSGLRPHLATDDDEATQIFEDRKIQNHSCSISQFKLFLETGTT